MHIGLIPDGNRRWCAKNGVDLQGLIAHHVTNAISTVYTMLVRFKEMLPLRDVDALSVYVLSLDNLTKRSDHTTAMVTRILTLFFVAVYACSIAEDHPDQREDLKIVQIDVDRVMLFADACNLASIAPPSPDDVNMLIDAIMSIVCDVDLDVDISVDLDPSLDQAIVSCIPPEWVDMYMLARSRVSERCPPPLSGTGTRTSIRICRKTVDGSGSGSNYAGLVAIEFFGELHELPPQLCLLTSAIKEIMRMTRSSSIPPRFTLRVAIAYDPVADMQRRPKSTSPIDLVIRTSGVQRSSGFFPSDTLYSEWMYPPALFPDLTIDDVLTCISRFREVQRRYGA
jgi:undecaprenyl pyrophosphate synthase